MRRATAKKPAPKLPDPIAPAEQTTVTTGGVPNVTSVTIQLEQGPTVPVRDWVLVKMPPEEGKPADRYAVVEVSAQAVVAAGRVIEDGSALTYARKRVAIEAKKQAEERARAPQVVG